jgi:uroporphyrinogen-III decarboxylase
MMYTHKPDDIRKYCRWLIDTCAPGGGYILCMGSSLAGWNDPANLHAMIDTVKEYGRYR